MRRRTKILATLGPASSSEVALRALVDAGLDAVRLNFSHGTKDVHRANFERVRRIAVETGAPLPVVQDIQGPKIRVGALNEPMRLEAGQEIRFVAGEKSPAPGVVPITYDELASDVKPGDRILMDDGYLGAAVTAVEGRTVVARVEFGGLLKSNKGVNFPGVRLSIKFPTPKDKVDLHFGQELGVDYVAASFIRSAADIAKVRAELDDTKGTRVIAKVELKEAVENIDEIVRASDGVMVARGDLGVELAPWEVPAWQKRIIRLCDALGVPVITATQMLESMIENPRPTRAEATDVFNAVMDGTSAVMLSGETAVGKHPVETVRTMARICDSAEASWRADARPIRDRQLARADPVSDAVAHAACRAAEDLGAAAIVALTNTGTTARFVSKYKPAVPIIGATPAPATMRQLALTWGVAPLLIEHAESRMELLRSVEAAGLRAGLLKRGEVVVVTSGQLGMTGTTNQIRVLTVGRFVVGR